MRSYVAIAITILLFCVLSATAMIVRDHKFKVNRQDRFTSLFSFYFAEQGYLDLNVTISPDISEPIQLMFCSDKELEPLRSSYVTFESVCHELPLGLCSKEYTVTPLSFHNNHRAAPSLLLKEFDRYTNQTTHTVFSSEPTTPPTYVPLEWSAASTSPPSPSSSDSTPIDFSRSDPDPLESIFSYSSSLPALLTDIYGDSTGHPAGVDLQISYPNTIPTRDRYRLLQLNCPESDYEGRLSHVAINPGGEYLSLTYVPYKTLYRVSFVVFAVLLVGWALHLYKHRSLNTRAQQLLLVLPTAKLLLAVAADRYWNLASETGFAPAQYYWCAFVLLLGARAAVFLTALTLATGYGFLHARVPRMFSSRIALLVAAYLFSYALLQLDFGMALLLTVVNYAFVWQLFSLLIAFSLRDVAQQIDVLHRHQINFVLTPLYPKLLMLQRIQPAFVAFVVIDLFCSLWGNVAYATAPWLQDAADHIASALLLALLMRALYLQPFNAHLHTLAALMNKTLTAQLHAAVAQELSTRITPATHGYHAHDNPRITALLPATEPSTAMMFDPSRPVPSPLPGELLRHVRGEAPNKRRYGHCLVHNACQCPCEDSTDGAGVPPAVARGTLGRYFQSRCCGHASVAMLFARVGDTALQGAHMGSVGSQRLAGDSADVGGAGDGKGRGASVSDSDGVNSHGVIVGSATYQDVVLHAQDHAYTAHHAHSMRDATPTPAGGAISSPRWGSSWYSRLVDE